MVRRLLFRLVPEASAPAGVPSDLNGDGDDADAVVHVRPVPDGVWKNLGQSADAVAVSGSIVAIVTSEAQQGNAPCGGTNGAGATLNSDGDCDDRVLQLYDAARSEWLPWRDGMQAAEDLVIGGTPGCELVAFRTSETAQDVDLNHDQDKHDDVLQVYDVAARTLVNSGSAVTACPLATACDPHRPYGVGADTVTFLTYQGHNAVGSQNDTDLMLQHLNVRQVSGACGAAPGRGRTVSGNGGALVAPSEALHTLETVTAGICVGAADAAGVPCTVDADCGLGTCATSAAAASCGAAGACAGTPADLRRLGNPFAALAIGGRALASVGRCREAVPMQAGSCPLGTARAADVCWRDHGSCVGDADCPPASTCRRDPVVATANDADADEVPDAFDNCPSVPNVDQSLEACRAATPCGNGVVAASEECDDGNQRDGDACSSACRLCSPTPRTGCLKAPAGRSQLTMATRQAGPGRTTLKRLAWTWRGTEPPAVEDFGDPLRTTGYALCVYDGATASAPLLELTAPAGARCADAPCWTYDASRGFRHRGPASSDRRVRMTLDIGRAAGAPHGRRTRRLGVARRHGARDRAAHQRRDRHVLGGELFDAAPPRSTPRHGRQRLTCEPAGVASRRRRAYGARRWMDRGERRVGSARHRGSGTFRRWRRSASSRSRAVEHSVDGCPTRSKFTWTTTPAARSLGGR